MALQWYKILILLVLLYQSNYSSGPPNNSCLLESRLNWKCFHLITNCMEINLYFQAWVRNAKVCLPLSPPCHSVSACHETLSSLGREANNRIRKRLGDWRSRYWTWCIRSNWNSSTYVLYPCLSVLIRTVPQTTNKTLSEKNKTKRKCCRGCEHGCPSFSWVRRLLCTSWTASGSGKKDFSVTQLTLTCFIHQLIFNLCIHSTNIYAFILRSYETLFLR